MGGNALLYAKTERKSKERYNQLVQVVMGTLSKLFPVTKLSLVQSINAKADFGDMDILFENQYLPKDWIYQVWEAFTPDEMMINRIKAPGIRRAGPLTIVRKEIAPADKLQDGLLTEPPREHIPCSAISFEVDNFQIDLVVTEPENWTIANVYYAYNDLGNLMGRIADRMGMKYGWDGLWKDLGEGNDIYESVLVTRDPQRIFEFLGYDFRRWKLGFEQFENMFEFAASTPWFHRAPYQFENRNHKDRVRDEKRSTYRAFIEWIENKPWLDKYTWVSYERNQITPERESEKKTHFQRALEQFPGFRERVEEAQLLRQEEIDAKKVWNGGIVGVATGLSGEALGTFMRQCRERFEAASFQRFNGWIAQQSPEQVATFIATNLREIA